MLARSYRLYAAGEKHPRIAFFSGTVRQIALSRTVWFAILSIALATEAAAGSFNLTPEAEAPATGVFTPEVLPMSITPKTDDVVMMCNPDAANATCLLFRPKSHKVLLEPTGDQSNAQEYIGALYEGTASTRKQLGPISSFKFFCSYSTPAVLMEEELHALPLGDSVKRFEDGDVPLAALYMHVCHGAGLEEVLRAPIPGYDSVDVASTVITRQHHTFDSLIQAAQHPYGFERLQRRR